VRYVIGSKSNKITGIILTTSRMPQIVNDMIDIVSVAFLDIGYSGAGLRYKLFGIKKISNCITKGEVEFKIRKHPSSLSASIGFYTDC
jgi:hypothetical protein